MGGCNKIGIDNVLECLVMILMHTLLEIGKKLH